MIRGLSLLVAWLRAYVRYFLPTLVGTILLPTLVGTIVLDLLILRCWGDLCSGYWNLIHGSSLHG